MKHAMRLLAALATLAVVGCASNPGVPYDRTTSSDIKTIGLITPSFPTKATVARASSVGQSFGLVGALVEAGLQTARESNFANKIAPQKLNATAVFHDGLKQALKANGYTVVDVPLARPTSDLLETYPPTTNPPVDAYLDVVVSFYGYVAAGVGDSTPYRPAIATQVRLTKRGATTVLMRDLVQYNPTVPNKDVISISPDPKYVFVDSDALLADPVNATAGLKQSLAATAQSIGTLLK